MQQNQTKINLDDYYKLIHWVIQNRVGIPREDKDYEDLYQIGCIGLVNARNNFDESKNIAFSTYATKCIYNQIMGELRNQAKPSKNTKNTVSLNMTKTNVKGEYFYIEEVTSVDIDIIRDSENNEIIEKFNKMDFKYKDLYIDWLNGKRVKDIAKEHNYSSTYISHIIKGITKKLREELL